MFDLRRVVVATAAVGVLLVPASAAAAAAPPDPPAALPGNATASDSKWQPAMDYDTDGCYNVPAIGPDGRISEGLDHNYTTGSKYCRDQSDLDNTNAYARTRCNNGWCAHLYDYYFEKDVAVQNVIDAGGHRHDWEHVVVWTKDDDTTPVAVAVSGHGKYDVYAPEKVIWEGTHPKVVYHKDGGSTHRFRLANTKDEPAENHYHDWRRSTLVSWDGFPDGLRDKLLAHDFGHAHTAIDDGSFPGNLTKSKPGKFCQTVDGKQVCEPVNFDINKDEQPKVGTAPQQSAWDAFLSWLSHL